MATENGEYGELTKEELELILPHIESFTSLQWLTLIQSAREVGNRAEDCFQSLRKGEHRAKYFKLCVDFFKKVKLVGEEMEKHFGQSPFSGTFPIPTSTTDTKAKEE